MNNLISHIIYKNGITKYKIYEYLRRFIYLHIIY